MCLVFRALSSNYVGRYCMPPWNVMLLPTNCLSVFSHFVGLALKGLRATLWNETLLQTNYSVMKEGCLGRLMQVPWKWTLHLTIFGKLVFLSITTLHYHRQRMSQIMDKKLYQLNQYQLIKSYGLYQNKP